MDRKELPKNLKKNIILLIRKEEYIYAKRHLLVASLLCGLSFIGSILSFRYVFQGFEQSSFYSYASLLFSDPDILFQYWKEFTSSLVESLPLFEITILFVVVGTLLFSIRIFVKNMQNKLSPQFIS